MNNRFNDLFDQAGDAFDGIYKTELGQLQGLSQDVLDTLLPTTEDKKEYLKLIDVVKQASQENLTQAELINNIKDLGSVAVKIAKKIPKFAALL